MPLGRRCTPFAASQDCNVFANVSDEARREVRARVVAMVLATDLSVNFPTINAFKQMVTEKSNELDSILAATAEAAASTAAANAANANLAAITQESSTAASTTPLEKRAMTMVGFLPISAVASSSDSCAHVPPRLGQ